MWPMSDEDIIRKLMYGSDQTDDEAAVKKSESKFKNVNVSGTSKAVIMEVNGVKHYLPSLQQMETVMRENIKLRDELVRLNTAFKKLTEVVRKIDNGLRTVERDLTHKADVYGEN